MSYLHGLSVCHGDLKCENVLLFTASGGVDGARGAGASGSPHAAPLRAKVRPSLGAGGWWWRCGCCACTSLLKCVRARLCVCMRARGTWDVGGQAAGGPGTCTCLLCQVPKPRALLRGGSKHAACNEVATACHGHPALSRLIHIVRTAAVIFLNPNHLARLSHPPMPLMIGRTRPLLRFTCPWPFPTHFPHPGG